MSASSPSIQLPSYGEMQQEYSARGTRTQLDCGPYQVTLTKQFFTVEKQIEGPSPPDTGWKVHVSIDQKQLSEAWKIFSELAVRYDIRSFKIVNDSNPGLGKQITIYCGADLNKKNFQGFLIELNTRLKTESVAPDKQPGKLIDCKKISENLMIKNEKFTFSGGLSCFEGAADPHYISDLHIDFAKKVWNHMNGSGLDFEKAFIRIKDRDHGFAGDKYRKTVSGYRQQGFNVDFFEDKFKKDIFDIIEFFKKRNLEKQGIEELQYNLGSNPDIFGFEEDAFIKRLAVQSVTPVVHQEPGVSSLPQSPPPLPAQDLPGEALAAAADERPAALGVDPRPPMQRVGAPSAQGSSLSHEVSETPVTTREGLPPPPPMPAGGQSFLPTFQAMRSSRNPSVTSAVPARIPTEEVEIDVEQKKKKDNGCCPIL